METVKDKFGTIFANHERGDKTAPTPFNRRGGS